MPKKENLFKVWIIAFGSLGREHSSCGYSIPPLMATLEHLMKQKQRINGKPVYCAEPKCFPCPLQEEREGDSGSGWLPYLTREGRIPESGDKEQFNVGRNPDENIDRRSPKTWQEIRQKVREGFHLIVIGASSGCIGATHCAHTYPDNVLSVVLMSCVPGREQWRQYNHMECPVSLTIGKHENFFGGQDTLWEFAKLYSINVFPFTFGYETWVQHANGSWSKALDSHMAEQQAGIINRVAAFVAEAATEHAGHLAKRKRIVDSDSDEDSDLEKISSASTAVHSSTEMSDSDGGVSALVNQLGKATLNDSHEKPAKKAAKRGRSSSRHRR